MDGDERNESSAALDFFWSSGGSVELWTAGLSSFTHVGFPSLKSSGPQQRDHCPMMRSVTCL